VAIKIDFLSNTRSVTRDVENVGDALDKVADSLDDVARDAKRSGDKVSDAYKDAGKDAERSAEKVGDAYKDAGRDGEQSADRLERAFKDASDATAKAATDGGKELGDGTRRGVADAKEGLGEFRDEANSTAREAAASFDGSAESIGDAFQEVTANAFAGFGPAGAVAGLAAAAGLGLVFAQLEKNKEKTEQLNAITAELAAEYIDTGQVGQASMDFVIGRLKELATTTEDGEKSLSDLKDTSDAAGSNFQRLAQAYAGNSEGLDELVQSAQKRLKQLREENVAQGDVTGGINRAQTALERQIEAQEEYVDLAQQAQRASKDAAEDQAAYVESGAEALQRQTEAEEQRTQAAVDGAEERRQANEEALAAEQAAADDYSSSVVSAYEAAGAAVNDYVEEGVFNLEKYTEESRKQADAVTAYQANMVALSGQLSADAFEYIQGLGPAAAPLIDAFVKAPLEQKEATAAVWSQLGATSSDSFSKTLQVQLDAANYRADVALNVSPQEIQNAIASRNYYVAVNARVNNNIQSQLPANQGMGVP
jgi:hypothetical protein